MNEQILAILSRVIHPDGEQNIVELGIAKVAEADARHIAVVLHFKRPRDPFAGAIRQQCEQLLKQNFPQSDVQVSVSAAEVKPSAKQAQKPLPHAPQQLENVKHIVAVMSGKGGVGKSTVAANVAIALAQMGYKVGLLDADIYGPSIPKMFGVEDAKPVANEKEQLVPIEKYGVRVLSIGFFVNPQDPLIWRGPMATSALKQLLLQADWGALDFLMIDMPPGTGDIHLTLLQEMKLAGVVVVSTPQQVALADAVKGINMLRNEKMKTSILGLVENMAWFTPEELPQNRYYIFGKQGCQRLAEEMEIPLLGEVPIVQSVCSSGDSGTPSALSEGLVRDAFMGIAEKMVAQL